jgi:uncharacterized OB-fold protein
MLCGIPGIVRQSPSKKFLSTHLKRESTFVTCRGCGQRVFRDARRCPACRRRMRFTRADWQKIGVIVAALLLAVALIWMVAINSEM